MKQHFEDVQSNNHEKSHTTRTLELLPSESGIMFKPTGSSQSFRLLIGGPSPGQQPVKGPHEVVSLASVVARTTYLQQQPYLFKLAARVAMHWAQSCMGAVCFRDAPEFIELLVLKAFQQYQESAPSSLSTLDGAPSTATAAQQPQHESWLADADDVDWFAMDMILLNFLKLSAGLCEKSLCIYWDAPAAIQVLADPDLAAMLRPGGFEAHPLLLDPTYPAYNVATALTAEELHSYAQHAQQRLFHAYDATLTILMQRLQQVPATTIHDQQPPSPY